MSVTHRASINNLPDKSRSSAGRTVHEGHGNRNGTDEVIRTDNGSIQSHLLCPVLLLLFITEIILLLTLLFSTLLFSTLLVFIGFFPFTGGRFSALYSPLRTPSFLYRFRCLFSASLPRLPTACSTTFFFMIAIHSGELRPLTKIITEKFL